MDCPFCHTPQQEKHRMLYEGKNTVAFLANPRMMTGHTLVVPKKHVKNYQSLTKKNEGRF